MKKLLLSALLALSFSASAATEISQDWRYEEYYPNGGKIRYDTWTQAANFRSFVVSCNVDHRKGEPEISFFISTNDPIHNRGEDIVVTLKFGKTHFELPARVSNSNPTNAYVYPFIDGEEIIELMKRQSSFEIFIPVASGAAHVRQTFSLMGFNNASLGLRKICKL